MNKMLKKISKLQEYESPILICNEGLHGEIYRISDKHVAKVPHVGYNGIKNEERTTKRLFDLGISVPKPFGIEHISIRTWKKRMDKKAFVMEFAPGKTGYELIRSSNLHERYILFEKSKLLYFAELEKAEREGLDFEFDRVNLKNYIFDMNEKVKLIDFATCSFN